MLPGAINTSKNLFDRFTYESLSQRADQIDNRPSYEHRSPDKPEKPELFDMDVDPAIAPIDKMLVKHMRLIVLWLAHELSSDASDVEEPKASKLLEPFSTDAIELSASDLTEAIRLARLAIDASALGERVAALRDLFMREIDQSPTYEIRNTRLALKAILTDEKHKKYFEVKGEAPPISKHIKYFNVMHTHIMNWYAREALRSLQHLCEIANNYAFSLTESATHTEEAQKFSRLAVDIMQYLYDCALECGRTDLIQDYKFYLANYYDTRGWVAYRLAVNPVTRRNSSSTTVARTRGESVTGQIWYESNPPLPEATNNAEENISPKNLGKMLDELDEAHVYFLKAIRYDPSIPIIHYHIACYHYASLEVYWQANPVKKAHESDQLRSEHAAAVDEHVNLGLKHLRQARDLDVTDRLIGRLAWLQSELDRYQTMWWNRFTGEQPYP